MNVARVKIIVCKSCGGEGTKEKGTLIDYHKGIYDYTREDCRVCKGSGRMKKTKTITVEPYQP